MATTIVIEPDWPAIKAQQIVAKLRTKGGAAKLTVPAMRAYMLDLLTEHIAEALHDAYRRGLADGARGE